MVSKKKIPKKSDGKESYRDEARKIMKKRRLVNISLAVVLVVLVIVFGSIVAFNTLDLSSRFSLPELFPKEEQTPAATVNDQVISMQELDDRYALIPEQYKTIIPKAEVLSQMIDEKLLLMDAEDKGIQTADSEVEEQISAFKEYNLISDEDLQTFLSNQGLTLQDLKDYYRKDITLNKLLNQTLEIEVTDEEVAEFYDENIEQFTVPQAFNVSHLLVCHNESLRCTSNLTKSGARQKAEGLRDVITKENFADVALDFSDEPAAQLTKGNLGWISREDPFDETFLNATFALRPGEISQPVETDFGYHIIIVYEKRDAELLELDSVTEDIRQYLTEQEQLAAYEEYIASLRENADVAVFYGEMATG